MISVIVSVYNSEKYLRKCINSILDQIYTDYELILVNDGSTDSSSLICKEFEKLNDNIKYFEKRNGGLSSARNYGISKSCGEFLLFLDSDDWFEHDMLEKLMLASSNGKYDVVTQGFQIDYATENYTICETISEDLGTNSLTFAEVVELLEESGLFNSACNKLYKKSVILENDISFRIDMEPGEDLLFNCLYFQHITTCICLNYSGYHYVKHGDISLTSKYYSNYEDKILQFYQARKSLYEKMMMPCEDSKRYLNNSMTSYVISAISNIYNIQSGNTFQTRSHIIHDLFKDDTIKSSIENCTFVNFYVILLRFHVKQKSPIVANMNYTILFWLRRNFKTIYNAFRRKVLYGK